MNVKFRALFSVLLLAAVSALSLPAQETLRIATFNNQYENKVHPWADRADRVYKLIEAENWDIVGMQEPFWNQMADMDAKLTQYGWIGNSTDGKIEDGYWHYNPIFYRKARLEMLDWGRFWFSETPDVPGSKSWDSHTSRFCVWGHFRDRRSGRDFYHFNVHYDHKGETARRESSRLLLARIAAVAAGKPYFVTGDFNTEEGTPAYDILVDAGLTDAFFAAPVRTGDRIASWNDWKPMLRVEEPSNLDHVFISPGTKALSWRLVITKFGGEYPSDHFPITVEWQY